MKISDDCVFSINTVCCFSLVVQFRFPFCIFLISICVRGGGKPSKLWSANEFKNPRKLYFRKIVLNFTKKKRRKSTTQICFISHHNDKLILDRSLSMCFKISFPSNSMEIFTKIMVFNCHSQSYYFAKNREKTPSKPSIYGELTHNTHTRVHTHTDTHTMEIET